MTYLSTVYDREDLVVLPVRLESGRSPMLRITEGFLRRSKILGRCTASPAVLGFKTGDSAATLHVSLTIGYDATSRQHLPDDPGWDPVQPRVALVFAQRRLRGAVLLSPTSTKCRVTDTVSFTLARDEVPEGGVALVEIWGLREWLPGLPSDGWGRVATHSPVGLAVRSVSISAEPQEEPAEKENPDAEFVLVHPGRRKFTIRAAREADRDPRPAPGRRAWLSARELLRRPFKVPSPRAGAISVMDGSEIPVRVVRRGRAAFDVTVAAHDHPVLVRLRSPRLFDLVRAGGR